MNMTWQSQSNYTLRKSNTKIKKARPKKLRLQLAVFFSFFNQKRQKEAQAATIFDSRNLTAIAEDELFCLDLK